MAESREADFGACFPRRETPGENPRGIFSRIFLLTSLSAYGMMLSNGFQREKKMFFRKNHDFRPTWHGSLSHEFAISFLQSFLGDRSARIPALFFLCGGGPCSRKPGLLEVPHEQYA
jgi:hypothetical protein